MRGDTQLLSARSVRWLDVGVVVWVVVWAVLGVLVWQDIPTQSRLPADLIKVGSAVQDTGQALGVVGGLPLVGGRIGAFAGRIEKMGPEVVVSGRNSRESIERVAVIAGLVRRRAARDHRAVPVPPRAGALAAYVDVDRRGAAGRAGDPAFEQYLARRAADALPWDEPAGAEPRPVARHVGGDYRALADAELRASRALR